MPNDPLNSKLLEIENHLRDLNPEQRDQLLDWIKTGKQQTANIIKIVNALQDSLDTLRVHIKYTVFDLECTRRENQVLRDRINDMTEEMCSRGHYSEDEPMPGIEVFPPAGNGLIDIPETGDFIHSSECDHPYDAHCWCEYCDACRIRMQQHGEGAD